MAPHGQTVLREVMAPVCSWWRAFALGAAHTAGVLIGALVLGAWLWGVL